MKLKNSFFQEEKMNILNDILIDKGKTIIEAMKQLDKTAKRILFVVDENKSLIGSLTDGDIRRYILKFGKLDGFVEQACNKNPYFVFSGFDKEKIKNNMISKDLKYIPVLNEGKKIIEILINESQNNQISINPIEKINIPVVIMAGGFGTRLEPFTKILPKPLIPIGDKTIIEIVIDNFKQYGVSDFWISLNYKSSIIKSYLLDLPYDKLNFIEEQEPLGTAGSLYLIKNKIKSDCLVLTNCDIIIDADFYDILNFHKNKKNDITLIASLQSYKIPYGICEIKEDGVLENIVEKPEYNFLISTGIYIINREILKLIPSKKFFHATNLLSKAKSSGFKVGVYPISQNSWRDIGQWDEYKKVIERFKI